MHALQSHVGSYYAATANEHPDFPPLRGEHNADVRVIGAGFTGISTALQRSSQHLRDLESGCRYLEANHCGHEYRLLSQAEPRDLIGADAYIGALLNMGNGHLHPLNLCIGEARAAVANGTTICEQSPVTHIEHGVNVTHVTGQILTETIAGTSERFDLISKLKTVRLPGAATFSRQLVSLGMIYYGLKDRL